MNDQEARDEREAMALHLWDTGLVRPEWLAFEVVDAFLEAGWGKHPEPEWEYGTALQRPDGTIWDFEVDTQRHALAHVAECDISDHTPGESCVVVRREVTYGPWEPVQ